MCAFLKKGRRGSLRVSRVTFRAVTSSIFFYYPRQFRSYSYGVHCQAVLYNVTAPHPRGVFPSQFSVSSTVQRLSRVDIELRDDVECLTTDTRRPSCFRCSYDIWAGNNASMVPCLCIYVCRDVCICLRNGRVAAWIFYKLPWELWDIFPTISVSNAPGSNCYTWTIFHFIIFGSAGGEIIRQIASRRNNYNWQSAFFKIISLLATNDVYLRRRLSKISIFGYTYIVYIIIMIFFQSVQKS